MALGKRVFASSIAHPAASHNPRFAVDGVIPGMSNGPDDLVFASNATDPKPWLSIDLGAYTSVTQIVYHNNMRNGSDCSGLEFRIGGAEVVSTATAAVQMTLNEEVYKVPPAAGPSGSQAISGGSCSSSSAVVYSDGDGGVLITVDLEFPIVGRYITLQNTAGGRRDATPVPLRVSELQVYGEPEVCTTFQDGMSYGNDEATLSTLSLEDEGACCRACVSSEDCLYWDFQRASSTCRLKGLAGALSPDGRLPALTLDVGLVAGARRAVGVFTRHPLFSYSHDKATRWIWSRPDAAANAPPPDITTHLFRAYYSPEAMNATMKVIAADYASVSVNGVLKEPARTWPFAAVVPLALQQGHNLIVLHCRNYGGAAMAAAAIFATDGNNSTAAVLLRTDHTWGWIEGPIQG